jgi:hypothetical protein
MIGPDTGFLEDRLGRAAAERLLVRRRRFGRTVQPGTAAACFELVGLPVAWREAKTVSASASESRPALRLYLVDRVLGHAWAVALTPRSSDGTQQLAMSSPTGAVLPARLGLDDCASRLETLAARGALTLGRGRLSALPELAPVRAASYPFWLRYSRDGRGRYRFEALDAVTGRRPGSGLRAALAAALIDADPE